MSTEQAEVYLEYRRVGEKSTGRLYVMQGGQLQQGVFQFENLAFDAMLYELARKLALHADASVYLLRTDRSGCLPYKLDDGTVALLRADPVSMAQALTVAGSPSSLLLRAQQAQERVVMPLRVGVDVLADAFGEVVYVRLSDGEVECPGCGFWSPLDAGGFRCRKRCHVQLDIATAGRWATVPVTSLLASPLQRFYLPRVWNTQLWITKDELAKLYQAFISEREAALCSRAVPVT